MVVVMKLKPSGCSCRGEFTSVQAQELGLEQLRHPELPLEQLRRPWLI
jgi:hypothetical protein